MTDQDGPEQRNGNEGDEGRPELTALEERVVRLELEMAALQRRIAARPVEKPDAWSAAAPAARIAPPLMRVPDSASDDRRLASEMWGSASPYAPKAAVAESRESLENRLGSQIFNRIAIVLLLIGTACFLKLAVDRRWIVPSPTGRVIVGLLAGAGLVLWSERFRRKGFAAFSYSLKAVGSGVLYLSLWAAFQLYGLIPASVAMGLMILVTAWNAYMAWAQNSGLMAAYALAGGFATPMLVSTGGNHEIFLFTYLLAIDLATVALVRLKSWPRLLLGAFPPTVAFFIVWYREFYAVWELTTTSIFIVLFGMAFASVAVQRSAMSADSPIARSPRRAMLVEEILLPLANAAFVTLAFYSVLEDSGHHALLPWLMVVLATAYLGLMRAPQSRTASAVHLTLAVVLLTIAIPLKASGHWITVSWLVEGLALLWVAARLEPGVATADSGESYATSTLRWLAMGSLVLGYCGICVHADGLFDVTRLTLLNWGTGTALIGIAVFAAVAWLALHTADTARAGLAQRHTLDWGSIAIVAFILIDVTAVLLTLRELLFSWDRGDLHPPFQTADFITALIGLAVFAGVVGVSHRIARGQPDAAFWTGCAALSTIAFNLIAVLTGVREIEAIWERSSVTTPDAALQQALAISGFLMVYGAGLLAVGFWKRSEFLRWQALLLLVFTIFKTFLYDMRNLSEGYRVVSLLGLGALLMAVSFAYQRDWLNLHGAEETHSVGVKSDAESGATR
jgi:uncharacterized membrane protein